MLAYTVWSQNGVYGVLFFICLCLFLFIFLLFYYLSFILLSFYYLLINLCLFINSIDLFPFRACFLQRASVTPVSTSPAMRNRRKVGTDQILSLCYNRWLWKHWLFFPFRYPVAKHVPLSCGRRHGVARVALLAPPHRLRYLLPARVLRPHGLPRYVMRLSWHLSEFLLRLVI